MESKMICDTGYKEVSSVLFWVISRGALHVIVTQWCFAGWWRNSTHLHSGSEKVFQGRYPRFHKPSWADIVVQVSYRNWLVYFRSCLYWLRQVFWTSTVVSWLLLRARYVLVLFFPQPISCHRLRFLFCSCLVIFWNHVYHQYWNRLCVLRD